MDVALESAPLASDALAEIAAVRDAFAHALREGDVSALAKLYDEDARLVAPEAAPLRGRRDAASFWQAGVDSGITGVDLEPDEVELLPTVAWEVGRYVLRLQSSRGDPFEDRGRYLLVYRLDAGSWRRAAEMFAPDSPSSDLWREP
jgi:ketosteroid isomerase-like protein